MINQVLDRVDDTIRMLLKSHPQDAGKAELFIVYGVFKFLRHYYEVSQPVPAEHIQANRDR